MSSWRTRIQEYNEENNIVTLPFQNGGEIQNANTNGSVTTPSLNDLYFQKITLNNKEYSLNQKSTVQLIKRIITYYEKNR
jgi:hypothetical protein